MSFDAIDAERLGVNLLMPVASNVVPVRSVCEENASPSMRCERLNERSNCCHSHWFKELIGPCVLMAVNVPIRVTGGVPDRTVERKMAFFQTMENSNVQSGCNGSRGRRCKFAEVRVGSCPDMKG